MSIQSQDTYIRHQFRISLYCPACKERHSVMELIGGEEKFEEYSKRGVGTMPLKCLKTQEELVYQIGLFAGEHWFELKSQRDGQEV